MIVATYKNIEIFVTQTGELATNSVVISDGKYCIVFDPDGAAIDWVRWFCGRDLHPVAIYLTHGHYDHMGALADLVEGFVIPWYMHADDKEIIKLNNSMGWMMGCPRVDVPDVESMPLKDGIVPPIRVDLKRRTQIVGRMEFIHTPGHTPGAGMFYLPDLNVLISGDTVFADSVGRWDLPLGSADDMQKSIARIRARALPANTRVIPGHGSESTMGEILVRNRYFQ